jgi:hypothetical protein
LTVDVDALDLRGDDRGALEKALLDHTLAIAILTGRYERSAVTRHGAR